MNPNWIFVPLLAQVALTALVWAHLYWTRLGYVAREGIDPQALADDDALRRRLAAVCAPSDNFINQFELPVLFYAAVLTAFVTRHVDTVLVTLAAAFVALRALHTLIHLSTNRVTHRFAAYVAGSLVLWGLWTVLGLRLLGGLGAQG